MPSPVGGRTPLALQRATQGPDGVAGLPPGEPIEYAMELVAVR
jgi:hypothetical protein